MLPKEVFLSHSSVDRDFTDSVAETLRNHGIPVWYSRKDIRGAQQWHDEIGAALNRCDWFIVILSTKSVESMWVKRELMFALDDKRFQNRILPIVLESCEYKNLSWTLSLFEMIDFTGDQDVAWSELLKTWGLGYRK